MDRDGMGVELLGPGARPRTQAHTDAEELYRRIQRVMPELEATRAHLENLDSNMRTAAAMFGTPADNTNAGSASAGGSA